MLTRARTVISSILKPELRMRFENDLLGVADHTPRNPPGFNAFLAGEKCKTVDSRITFPEFFDNHIAQGIRRVCHLTAYPLRKSGKLEMT